MSPSAPTNHIGFQDARFLVSMLISRKANLIFLTYRFVHSKNHNLMNKDVNITYIIICLFTSTHV